MPWEPRTDTFCLELVNPTWRKGIKFMASGGSIQGFDSLLLRLAFGPERLTWSVHGRDGCHSDMFFRWSWKQWQRKGQGRTYNILTLYRLLSNCSNINGRYTAGGLNTLIPRGGRTLYFIGTNGNVGSHHPNTAITVSCKHSLSTVVSVRLTSLLGVMEIGGMAALQILRALRSLYFWAIKTRAL